MRDKSLNKVEHTSFVDQSFRKEEEDHCPDLIDRQSQHKYDRRNCEPSDDGERYDKHNG